MKAPEGVLVPSSEGDAGVTGRSIDSMHLNRYRFTVLHWNGG